jgi:prepilin signal peptidase PulO-like enzyme (type II secretory pathway)
LLYRAKKIISLAMENSCFWPVLISFIIFAVTASIIDVISKRIPDKLTIPCFLLIVILRVCLERATVPLFLLAACFGAALFFCVRVMTRGLGWGDVKFAALMGIVCGFPLVIAAFFAASVLGLIAACVTGAGRRGGRSPIPFGPFLCAGTLLSLLIARILQIF